jgi:dienelactone hydrolase
MSRTPLRSELKQVTFESVLVHEPSGATLPPGLLMAPNALGLHEQNLKQAERIAARGYAVLVVDLFGVNVRPATLEAARPEVAKLRDDRAALQERMTHAWHQLLKQKSVDQARLGAIGFCMGGMAALELARSGARVPAVVSFHGLLSTPKPATALFAKVLALHGADDPFVPRADVNAFEDEMRAAKADWELHAFGGTVHSFTDVEANRPGQAMYHARVAGRAYQLMDDFLAGAWDR